MICVYQWISGGSGFGSAPSFGGGPAFGGAAKFGAGSSFGGQPSFGSGAAFGSAPTFGNPAGGSTFGSSSPAATGGFARLVDFYWAYFMIFLGTLFFP